MGKEKEWILPEDKKRLADEIIQIFKKEDLTIRSAWRVCDEVRSRLHDLAYENKINKIS